MESENVSGEKGGQEEIVEDTTEQNSSISTDELRDFLSTKSYSE